MDCDHHLVAGSTACRYTYKYASLMGVGTVRFLEDVGRESCGRSRPSCGR